MKRSDFSHFIRMPVRWGDADALGHINNVQYARYLESGRVAYYHDALGIRFEPDTKVSLILADLRLSYLSQVHYPCELEIATRVSRLGGKSLNMEAAIFFAGEDKLALKSESVMVWFDYLTNATKTIPDDVRQKLRDFEGRPI